MPRGSKKIELANMWRNHLAVSLAVEVLEDEVQQLLAEDCSFRLPENQSLADSFVDKEEIELLSDLPVITQFRLLKLFEMLNSNVRKWHAIMKPKCKRIVCLWKKTSN